MMSIEIVRRRAIILTISLCVASLNEKFKCLKTRTAKTDTLAMPRAPPASACVPHGREPEPSFRENLGAMSSIDDGGLDVSVTCEADVRVKTAIYAAKTKLTKYFFEFLYQAAKHSFSQLERTASAVPQIPAATSYPNEANHHVS